MDRIRWAGWAAACLCVALAACGGGGGGAVGAPDGRADGSAPGGLATGSGSGSSTTASSTSTGSGQSTSTTDTGNAPAGENVTTTPPSTSTGASSGPPAVQVPPDAVRLASGGWVVARVEGELTTEARVRVQTYAADGSPLGGEIVANTVGEPLRGARVVPLAGGGFAITWMARTGTYQTGYGYTLPLVDVYARHFGARGQPVSGVVRVSQAQSFSYMGAEPTALAGGGYVVLWTVDTDLPNLPGYRVRNVFLRVLGADGTLVSAQVHAFHSYGIPAYSTTALADGGFSVAWDYVNPGGMTPYTRAYDAAGQPTGPAVAGTPDQALNPVSSPF